MLPEIGSGEDGAQIRSSIALDIVQCECGVQDEDFDTVMCDKCHKWSHAWFALLLSMVHLFTKDTILSAV